MPKPDYDYLIQNPNYLFVGVDKYDYASKYGCTYSGTLCKDLANQSQKDECVRNCIQTLYNDLLNFEKLMYGFIIHIKQW